MYTTKTAGPVTKPAIKPAGALISCHYPNMGQARLFDAMDRDGSGVVSREEYLSFGKTGPTKAKAKAFAAKDLNHDGTLNRKEFCYDAPRMADVYVPQAATEPADAPKAMGTALTKEAPKRGGLLNFIAHWGLFPAFPLPTLAVNWLLGQR